MITAAHLPAGDAIQFHIINDHNQHAVDGQIVQAATKCKRAALKRQLEMSGQTDFLKFPYHQGIIKNEIPLSIGGGIGQAP